MLRTPLSSSRTVLGRVVRVPRGPQGTEPRLPRLSFLQCLVFLDSLTSASWGHPPCKPPALMSLSHGLLWGACTSEDLTSYRVTGSASPDRWNFRRQGRGSAPGVPLRAPQASCQQPNLLLQSAIGHTQKQLTRRVAPLYGEREPCGRHRAGSAFSPLPSSKARSHPSPAPPWENRSLCSPTSAGCSTAELYQRGVCVPDPGPLTRGMSGTRQEATEREATYVCHCLDDVPPPIPPALQVPRWGRGPWESPSGIWSLESSSNS